MRLSHDVLFVTLITRCIYSHAFIRQSPLLYTRIPAHAVQLSSKLGLHEDSKPVGRWEETIYSSGEDDEDTCPLGYYHDSVKHSCSPLGPLGRISQRVETALPFRRAYHSISKLFGIDTKKISKLGVPFALAYSIISQLNGALSLSVAWYMTCQRTGLSPLAPGQWKALLQSYGVVYAAVQILRPFRVAAAIGMSKLSNELLESTQERLNCRKSVAIAIQYIMGYLAQFMLAAIGISVACLATGVPLLSTTASR